MIKNIFFLILREVLKISKKKLDPTPIKGGSNIDNSYLISGSEMDMRPKEQYSPILLLPELCLELYTSIQNNILMYRFIYPCQEVYTCVQKYISMSEMMCPCPKVHTNF